MDEVKKRPTLLQALIPIICLIFLLSLNDTITLVSFPGGIRQEKIYPKYEKISCHWGRKTFLTTSAFLGNSAELSAEIAGITLEVAKRYIKIYDTKKDEAMDKFD